MESQKHPTYFQDQKSYHLKASSCYEPCFVSSQKFNYLHHDPVYQFPILENKTTYLLPADTLTAPFDTKHTIKILHYSSPFKRGNTTPDPVSQCSLVEAPENSLDQARQSIYSQELSRMLELSEHNFHENSQTAISLTESSDCSFRPSLEPEKAHLDSNDRELILQIQREFHCQDQDDMHLRSITPNSSMHTDSQEYYGLQRSFSSIKISYREGEVISDWEPSPRNHNFDSEVSSEDEFRMSITDEGHAQLIRSCVVKESASHQIMQSAHAKPYLVKLQPKVLESTVIFSPTFQDACVITCPDGYSPLLRKLVVCENSEEDLELANAVPYTGYNSSLTIEYSTTFYNNFASTKPSKLTVARLFSESILQSLTKSAVTWVSCGYEHCLLVTLEGKVMTWGYGASGCLGQGDTNSYSFPKLLEGLSNIKYAEAGGYHNLAVSSIGEVYAWGRGDANQLGLTAKKLQKDEIGHLSLKPIKVIYFTQNDIEVKSVACGEAHSLVLDSNGTVYSFGLGQQGQLGICKELLNTRMNSGINALESLKEVRVTRISSGSLFSGCLSDQGEVYVWGSGEGGQLGNGTEVLKSDLPLKVENIGTVVEMVCGESSVLCLNAKGKVFGWGTGLQHPQESLVNFEPRQLLYASSNQHFLIEKNQSANFLNPFQNRQSLASELTNKLQNIKN